MTQQFLLCTFLFALSFCVEMEEPEKGSQEFTNLLYINCGPNDMTITLNLHPASVRPFMPFKYLQFLHAAEIKLGDCPLIKRERAMNLITTYDKCGIREQPVDFGKRYLGTITVRKGAKELLSTISCSFMKNQSFTTRFEISPNFENVQALNAAMITEYSTNLNGDVHIHMNPVFYSISRYFPEIFVYPAHCEVFSWEDPANSITIFEHGCPIKDERREYFLSQIYQPSVNFAAAELTELRLVMGTHLFPEGRKSTSHAKLGLRCTGFHCTSEMKHRISGMPLCPSAYHCQYKRAQEVLKVGRVKMFSAHLPIPINVDLTKIGYGSVARDAVPSVFSINTTEPEVACSKSSSTAIFAVLVAVGLAIGLILGFFFAKILPESLFSFSKRCGSSVKQADQAPQPYLKLETSPAALESPTLE